MVRRGPNAGVSMNSTAYQRGRRANTPNRSKISLTPPTEPMANNNNNNNNNQAPHRPGDEGQGNRLLASEPVYSLNRTRQRPLVPGLRSNNNNNNNNHNNNGAMGGDGGVLVSPSESAPMEPATEAVAVPLRQAKRGSGSLLPSSNTLILSTRNSNNPNSNNGANSTPHSSRWGDDAGANVGGAPLLAGGANSYRRNFINTNSTTTVNRAQQDSVAALLYPGAAGGNYNLGTNNTANNNTRTLAKGAGGGGGGNTSNSGRTGLLGTTLTRGGHQHPASGPPAKNLLMRQQALLGFNSNSSNNSNNPQSATVARSAQALAGTYGTRGVRRSPTHLASISPRSRQSQQPALASTKSFDNNGNGGGMGSLAAFQQNDNNNGIHSIDVTATIEPDTAEQLFGSTQVLSGFRQFATGRRLSDDASYGVVGGDGSRAFALGGSISSKRANQGNGLNSSSGNVNNALSPSLVGKSSPRMTTQRSFGLTMNNNNSSNNNNDVSSSFSPFVPDVSGDPLSLEGSASPKPSRRTNNYTSNLSGQVSPAPASPAQATPTVPPNYDFRVVLSSGRTSAQPVVLSVGSGCVQGMRNSMEDEHFAALSHTVVRNQPVSLLGVLDGHCGRRVADLGAKHLPEFFFSHTALGDNNALAMVESILQTDHAIFRALTKGSGSRKNHHGEFDFMSGPESGGSTLIAAAVHGRMLYVACLGDARAVLYDGSTTIAMSEDHKPANTKESKRITKCGGFVQFGRVCGVLAVSRALGDFEFKFTSGLGGNSSSCLSAAMLPGSPHSMGSKFSVNKELMVSNVADVRQINLTDESKFLILACDGLWDVLTNEEATQFVKDFLTYTPDINDPLAADGKRPKPPQSTINRALNNCAQKLAEFAVDRGSTDNVSVMVLFFHDVVDVVTKFNSAHAPVTGRTKGYHHKGGNKGMTINSSPLISTSIPSVEDILTPRKKKF